MAQLLRSLRSGLAGGGDHFDRAVFFHQGLDLGCVAHADNWHRNRIHLSLRDAEHIIGGHRSDLRRIFFPVIDGQGVLLVRDGVTDELRRGIER